MKPSKAVIPAKAGVQTNGKALTLLDCGFRRNDAHRECLTFYKSIGMEEK
jgi:hypothetical protein